MVPACISLSKVGPAVRFLVPLSIACGLVACITLRRSPYPEPGLRGVDDLPARRRLHWEDDPPESQQHCDEPRELCVPGSHDDLSSPLPLDLSEKVRKACDALPPLESEDAHLAKWYTAWLPYTTKHEQCFLEAIRQCHVPSISHQITWAKAQEAAKEKYADVFPSSDDLRIATAGQQCDIPEGVTEDDEDIEKSWEWFNCEVQVYILNLPEEKKRWEAISENLDALGVRGYERVSGVSMMAPGAEDEVKKEGLVPEDYDVMKAVEVDKDRSMGGVYGNLGAICAHLRAVDRAIKSNRKRYSLILEDDSFLHKRSAAQILRLMKNDLPCNWQVLNLRQTCPYGTCVSPHVLRVRSYDAEPDRKCTATLNSLSAGLFYKTAEMPAVREVLTDHAFDPNYPECLPTDVLYSSIGDRIYYYSVPGYQFPQIVTTESSPGSATVKYNMLQKLMVHAPKTH